MPKPNAVAKQTFRIIRGDAIVTAASYLKPNSFDACLCDPPYGFCAFTKMKTQAWEKEDVPDAQLWHEVFRVLRPGALMMAASGAKTYDLIGHAIREAGFEILDGFHWLYTQASATGVHEGYRLKPAHEPYVVARKPGKGGYRTQKDILVNGHVPTNLAMNPSVAMAIDMATGRQVSDFFYCAKAGKDERQRVPTDHPTLKPLALTEYLARLIHHPGARRLLVPFSGVGSEVIGGLRAGWEEVVGLEREKKYVDVAMKRVPAFYPQAEVA